MSFRFFARIQIIVGIWILISPWILGYASLEPVLWSNVIGGAIITVIGLWSFFGGEDLKK